MLPFWPHELLEVGVVAEGIRPDGPLYRTIEIPSFGERFPEQVYRCVQGHCQLNAARRELRRLSSAVGV